MWSRLARAGALVTRADTTRPAARPRSSPAATPATALSPRTPDDSATPVSSFCVFYGQNPGVDPGFPVGGGISPPGEGGNIRFSQIFQTEHKMRKSANGIATSQ